MIAALSLLGSVLGSVAPAQSSQVVENSSGAKPGDVIGANFAQVLAGVSADAISNLKAGEAASISGLQGRASVQQVVEAVMTAEQSLHTAVAIRDKVVSAYQSLSQMAI